MSRWRSSRKRAEGQTWSNRGSTPQEVCPTRFLRGTRSVGGRSRPGITAAETDTCISSESDCCNRRVSSDAPLRRHRSRPGHPVAGMVQHRPCSRPPPGRRLGRCAANHVRDERQSVREHVNRTGCARESDPTDARSPVTPRPYPALTRARQDVNAEPRTAHERSGHAYAKHVNGLAVAPTALPAGAPWERVNAARSVSRTGEMQHDHRDPSARRTGAPCAADGP